MADMKKGARITGAQRDRLANDLKKKYEKGASIRSLAESTGRSYGFVHRVLSEAGVALRGTQSRRRRQSRVGAGEALLVEAHIYLRDGQEAEGHVVVEALLQVLSEMGFEDDDIEILAPTISSFWQSLKAKVKDPEVKAAIEDRMTKLERAAEVQLLALPESQANQQNAVGMAALIESIKDERAAVIQVGSLLLVKVPSGADDSVLMCKTLTAKQMLHLERNPGLLRQPVEIVAALASVEDDQESPGSSLEKRTG